MTILQSVILGVALGLSVTNFLFNLGNSRRYIKMEKQVDILMENRLRDLLFEYVHDSHKSEPRQYPDSTKTNPDKT